MVLSVAFAYFVDQKGSKKVSLNYSVWVTPARHVANLARKDNARTYVLELGVCGLFGAFRVRLYFSFVPENACNVVNLLKAVRCHICLKVLVSSVDGRISSHLQFQCEIIDKRKGWMATLINRFLIH